MSEPERRVGVMVIRLWLEKSPISGLRARITRTVDLATRDETVTTVTSIGEILTQVQAWLRDFLSRSTPPRQAPGPHNSNGGSRHG